MASDWLHSQLGRPGRRSRGRTDFCTVISSAVQAPAQPSREPTLAGVLQTICTVLHSSQHGDIGSLALCSIYNLGLKTPIIVCFVAKSCWGEFEGHNDTKKLITSVYPPAQSSLSPPRPSRSLRPPSASCGSLQHSNKDGNI